MILKTKQFARQLDAAVAILEKSPPHLQLAEDLRANVRLYKNTVERKRNVCKAWADANPDKVSAYRKAYYNAKNESGKRPSEPRGSGPRTAETLDEMVARLKQPLPTNRAGEA
jgi:hypothetical protein